MKLLELGLELIYPILDSQLHQDRSCSSASGRLRVLHLKDEAPVTTFHESQTSQFDTNKQVRP